MTDRQRRVITQAAHGELGAAMVQMIDSDDQIICDHVRKAQRMLAELLDNSPIRKEEGKPAAQMASEAEAEEACKYLRAIIEAAENSNQAGENAAVKAADAVRSNRRNTSGDLLWFAEQIFNGLNTGMLRFETPADETLATILGRGRAALAKAKGDKTDG